jgi:DNA-binding protein HU-beta
MAKAPTAILPKPKKDSRSYTKTQLIAHLAEAVTNAGFGEVSKRQAAAFLDELIAVMIKYAPVGANLPGLGKLTLKRTPRRPARPGRNPATGEAITIPAKPAGKKLAFRISKVGKEAAGIV